MHLTTPCKALYDNIKQWNLMNRMAGAFFLLVISISHIMAWFLVRCGAFLGVYCLIKWFVNVVTFCIFYCWAELFVASLVFFLTFRFIIWVTLSLYFPLTLHMKIIESYKIKKCSPCMNGCELFYTSHHYLHCIFSHKLYHKQWHAQFHSELNISCGHNHTILNWLQPTKGQFWVTSYL